MIIYLSGREVGIQWGNRGVIHTIDREGNHGERFTRPPNSFIVYNEESFDEMISLYTTDISRIIEEWS